MPTSDEFRYDVFLSHSSKDKPRVRNIAQRLKAAGLTVWFDEWSIPVGADIYLSAQEGLQYARVQVLCLSQAALDSDWVGLEMSTALFRDPRNKQRRFIPILLSDCSLPDAISRYRYIDLRTNLDVEFNELVASCRNSDILAAKPKPALARRPLSTESNGDLTMRRQLLERVQKDQVDSRLGQGLREAIRVDLQLTETALCPKMYVFSDEAASTEPRETSEPIDRVFAESSTGSLAILGEPGTGKTNLLLELAQSLIAEADTDATKPIPVVFSLARWTLDTSDRSLENWMIDELKGYDVGSKAAEALVRHDSILPLLDGLDEVAADRREECVRAICEYGKGADGLRRLALCCRLHEYEQLALKPNVRTEVRVQLLTPDDVDREVAKPGLEHVRNALTADPALRALVRTPLWLHVLYLVAQTEMADDKSLAPLDRLFAQYVRYALNRDREGFPRRRTPDRRLLQWLCRLAKEMSDRDQTQFAVDDLDFSWFSAKTRAPGSVTTREPTSIAEHNFSAIRWLQRFSLALVVGSLGWVGGGWLFGLVVGLIPIFRVEGRIEPSEDLRFELSKAASRVWFSLAYGLGLGLTFGAMNGWLGGVCLGLVVALFEALQGGFQPRAVSRDHSPNVKTRRSLYFAGWIATTGLVIATSMVAVSKFALSLTFISIGVDLILQHIAFLAFVGAIVLAGEKGGWFAGRHYLTRVCMWRRGFGPLHYVDFLNESVERLFLIRRGSSFEFLHVTFRDYMAKSYCHRRDTTDAVTAAEPKTARLYCLI